MEWQLNPALRNPTSSGRNRRPKDLRRLTRERARHPHFLKSLLTSLTSISLMSLLLKSPASYSRRVKGAERLRRGPCPFDASI